MRFKLHHPLWTHLPALACIVINVGFFLSAQLPGRVSIDLINGLPDRWGSPLELWVTMLGWPLLILIGSAMLDEYYARHEQVRHFAWASLVDELLIGLLVARNVKMIPQLSDPEPVLSGWWPLALVFAGGAVALAVLLELRRPHLPSVDKVVDVAALAQSIQPQFQPGGRWAYWEKQNPLLWRCLSVLIAVFLAVIAGALAKESEYGGVVVFAFFAVFCMSGYDTGKINSSAGALRVAVAPTEVG
jgi:hypothetical protein